MAINQTPITPKARPGFTPAIRPLAILVVASAIAVALFSPAGIIYDHADLSFLVAPFVLFFFLRFLAKLCLIYLPYHGPYYAAEASARVFTGLAWAVSLFLFLSNAEMFTHISGFSRIRGFLDYLSRTAAWAVVTACGLTVSRLADTMRRTEWGNLYYPVINGLGLLFAGVGIWRFLATFSPASETFNKLGLVVFAGILAIALANAGHYGVKSKHPFIADACQWLAHSGAVIFVTAGLIATYILFFRPLIVNAFRYAAILEWFIICLAGWRLFSGIKNGIRLKCAVEVTETDWQKHVQYVSNLRGTDFPHLREIQELFVEDGSRDTLLVYLTLLMNANKVKAEEITRILHPLISHRDQKMPWFAFGWEQRRVIKLNEDKRREILEGIIADLKYVTNPVNQKIEENTDEQRKTG